MGNLGEKYSVEIEKGIYVIIRQPKTDLLPKFLARNPNDNELFLLFGNHGTYLLLKGNERDGLRACHSIMTKQRKECFAIGFRQDIFYATFTDPKCTRYQNPSLISGQTTVRLEFELFQTID